MKIRIRVAVPQDLDWIHSAIREMATEQEYFRPLYDEVESRKCVEGLILEGISIVAEDEKKGPLGFILGTITPHLYNPKLKLLSHLQWWVHPAHRKGIVTHMLFTTFVDIGYKHADVVTLSLRDDVPIKEESLKRYGFMRHDKCYFLFK